MRHSHSGTAIEMEGQSGQVLDRSCGGEARVHEVGSELELGGSEVRECLGVPHYRNTHVQ